ncbi:MAG: putative lipid II flippase FtsW [Pseudomonadota bacterium]
MTLAAPLNPRSGATRSGVTRSGVTRSGATRSGATRSAGTATTASRTGKAVDIRWPVDPVISGVFLLIVTLGLVMVASASSEISARNFENPFHMFIRHGAYMAIALATGLTVLSIPVRIWQRFDWLLLGGCLLLLVAVLVPGIGKEVNGSTRWIALGGFTLQGSEFAKLFIVVFMAGYLVRHWEDVCGSFKGFLKPLAIMAPVVVMLLMQPDFGASVVILAAVLGMIFLSGVPLRYFLPMILVVAAGAAYVIVDQPYRLARLTAFTDPWEHQFGGGYQLTQALIAFGRGEWFGLGLGNSIQKLFFLPEAHTDFLFSIIAEELGVLGAVVVIAAFATLVIRGAWIGRIAEIRGERFHALLAYGIALLLGVQAAINIGVNIGLLPTKGLTLPLMSYGGNSLIISFVLIAILLRVEYECVREPLLAPGRSARKKGGTKHGR